VRIKLPPVQANRFGFVDAADQQANPYGEQLHVRQGDANVARNNKSFVEHSVQNVEQIGCSGNGRRSLHECMEKTAGSVENPRAIYCDAS